MRGNTDFYIFCTSVSIIGYRLPSRAGGIILLKFLDCCCHFEALTGAHKSYGQQSLFVGRCVHQSVKRDLNGAPAESIMPPVCQVLCRVLQRERYKRNGP